MKINRIFSSITASVIFFSFGYRNIDSEIMTKAAETSESSGYEWYVEPTIQADYICSIQKGRTLDTPRLIGSITNIMSEKFWEYDSFHVYDTAWNSPYSCIVKGTESAIIDYSGELKTGYDYGSMYYGWYGCVLEDAGEATVYNEIYSRTFSDNGELSNEKYEPWAFMEVTNGYGIAFYSVSNNKVCYYWENQLFELENPPVMAVARGNIVDKQYGNYTVHTFDYYETDYSSIKYAVCKNGIPVTDFIYEDYGNYSSGLIPMKKDGKWGYLNEDGKVVIPFEYDDAWDYNGSEMPNHKYHYVNLQPYDAFCNYVVLCKNNSYGLYSTSNEEIIPFGEFSVINPVYDNLSWVKDKNTGLWGVIRITGKKSNDDSSVTYGDINNDGQIDASDASDVLTTYSALSTGIISGISETLKNTADVNQDSIIDASDASDILTYYSYLSTGGSGNSIIEFLKKR